MTSKSPVRACDDVDEAALSYAEIKALCAGDPRIREKIDLDVEVARLRLMKADHQNKKFQLEDRLMMGFPSEIEENRGFLAGFREDLQTLAAHPLPADRKDFVGMEIRGDALTDRDNAGAAIIEACREVRSHTGEVIGHYRGLEMRLDFDPFSNKTLLMLKGKMTHRIELGTDARGNLIRIENALAAIPDRIRSVEARLETLLQQQKVACEEVKKPFPYEEELARKSARLAVLDAELSIDKGHAPEKPPEQLSKSARPSVLERLNALQKAQPKATPQKHRKTEAR